MSEKYLSVYLEHIQEAVADACSFIDGMSKVEFLKDKKTQKAVCMNLLIIGETATKLIDQYPEFTALHPELPWRNMRGMRNRIAHGYFNIDFNVVWDTVKMALPPLIQALQNIPVNHDNR